MAVNSFEQMQQPVAERNQEESCLHEVLAIQQPL